MIRKFLFAVYFGKLTVTNYQIKTNKLKSPIRIVHLSDLHSCFHGKNQEELIRKIEQQNPDVILMTGDIADERVPLDGTIKLLAGITNKYPCYYVVGNHEIYSGKVDVIKEMFRQHNVTVLEGTCKVAEVKNQLINICGVDDPAIGEPIFEQQLGDIFASTVQNFYTILLSHRPERFACLSNYSCDLILSGHAHGGQWRIPFAVFAPKQGLFPKYTCGIYSRNGTKMLVSRGLSRESTKLPRIFNPPEVVVLDVVPN